MRSNGSTLVKRRSFKLVIADVTCDADFARISLFFFELAKKLNDFRSSKLNA